MLRPLGDRLLVKPSEAEEVTAGGIVLPDTAQEKPQRGEVLAVGPGRWLDNGEVAPMEVKVGNQVYFSKYGGTDLTIKGKEYKILRESDVLAIVVEDK